MRFSLGQFPPLASHGIFFLLGMLLNNGGVEPASDTHPLSPRRMQIALSKALLEHPAAHKTLQAGSPIALIKISPTSKNPQCRFLPEFAQLTQSSPFPVVDLPVGAIFNWKEFLEAKDKKNYRLLPLSQGARLPLCREAKKVSYGTLW